jgi:hypothetical protein
MKPILCSIILAATLLGADALAQQGGDAADLAAKMNAVRQGGNTYVRWKVDTSGGTIQLEGKERGGGSEVVYRVLWPKERKGEAILLRRGGGTKFTPPDKLEPVSAGQMDEPFFGSALANADLVENFFAWPDQKVVGTEAVNRMECTILESRPGRGGSIYGSVKSWIDTKRLVPMRVEKYSSSGALVRRIDTTKVVNDDRRRPIPANLTVRAGNRVSEVDGGKIKHGVNFTDREFSPEGLKDPSTASAE